MKSKKLKIRNIPQSTSLEEIFVKPTIGLVILMFIGSIVMLFNEFFSFIGLLIVAITLFFMTVAPDRKLIEFTVDFVVLYNCRMRDECFLIYWDDILSWRYVWHADEDELLIELVDGSFQRMPVFSRKRIIPLMRYYAEGKEKKGRA